MAVEHISKDNFDDKVLQGKGIIMVDFFADWCGPCKMLAPIVEELSESHTEARFYKVNVDEENELAVKYRVMSIPTLMVFKDGEAVKTSVGLVSKTEAEEMLKI
ncbi:MAG: thioredoxin [Alistipes sp.]|nr:thioredoxin [Alistipes sp.]